MTIRIGVSIALFALLFVFYLFRGRIRIEHGLSGTLIERFKPVERFGHWLLAGSFILLALTGLNLLYGKDLLIPILGKENFAARDAAIKAFSKMYHSGKGCTSRKSVQEVQPLPHSH